jgi:hypothetical protein
MYMDILHNASDIDILRCHGLNEKGRKEERGGRKEGRKQER